MCSPTNEFYPELQSAFDRFNDEVFDGCLPQCLITVQRKANSFGYFASARFVNPRGDTTDEIALNPAHFGTRSERGVLSTLVHEMVHLWQQHFGRPGRRGYHNRQWGPMMKTVGLYPSQTGAPGGREYGYQMTHYIIEGGAFDHACDRLLVDGFQLPWLENGHTSGKSPVRAKTCGSSNRWKYTCPHCGLNAWAKPEAELLCCTCQQKMPAVAQ